MDPTAETTDPTDSAVATEPADEDELDTAGRTVPTEAAETPYATSIDDETVTADGEHGSDGAVAASAGESPVQKPDAESEFAFDDESGTDAASDPEPASSDDPGDVVETYRTGLTAEDPVVRVDAIRDLAAAVESKPAPDQAAVDAIAERLNDDDASVRSAACEALGTLGASRVESRLRDRRIDPDPEVSRAASRALRDIE